MRNHLKFGALTLLLMALSHTVYAQKTYREIFEAAQKSYNAKQYDLALKQYREALDLSPNGWNDSSCISMMGRAMAALKRYDEALKWFELIETLPDINQNASARRFDYAGDLYYYQLKDYDKALENYRICIEQTTDFRHWAALQEKMAQIYLAVKKRPEAIHYLKSATMCEDPYYYASISARRQLAGLLLDERKDDEVIELLRDVDFKKYPKNERITAAGYGGIAAFRKKDYNLALKFLEQIDQKNSEKLIYSGRAYLALAQYDQARNVLLELFDNKRFNHRERGEAGLYIGDSYHSEKNSKEAIKAYKKALAITSDAKLKDLLQRRIDAFKPPKEQNEKP